MIFPSDIIIDAKQKTLVSTLEYLAAKLNNSFIKKLFSKIPVGIYIYGSVGSGKSMISKVFYDSLKAKKIFIHYQDFMQKIHKALHSYDSKNDIIERLADEYSFNANVLCIDEFEIKDITDAMMISRLFFALKKRKIFILITSNTAPNDLYKDGLKRDLFLPFINMLSSEFEIFHLVEVSDYRMTKIASARRVLYPLNEETRKEMDQIIHCLVDIEHLHETSLTVFGRKIEFNKTYKTTLITNFAELFSQNFSYNDYIAICNHFSTIVLEGIPVMDQDTNNEIIRFINFIDNIYFHNNLLFISLSDKPEKIYQGTAKALEFKRTISRLHEIESDSYFNNAKK